MITSNIENFSTTNVKAKVDIFKESTLLTSCTCSDALSNLTITRTGDMSKFFGFGVCQKIDFNVIDLERALKDDNAILPKQTVEVGFGDGVVWDNPYPTFYVDEVSRDEKSNTIAVTAYDLLNKASEITLSDIPLTVPYTVYELADACARYLGLNGIDLTGVGDHNGFYVSYPTGGNFDGSETMRQVFNAIAEVTQTVYFIGSNGYLKFIQLEKAEDFLGYRTIYRTEYFEATTQTPRTLKAICSATELGDNVQTAAEDGEIIQYVRNNPLWELRTDIAELLEAAIARVGGTTITQFYCDWDGDYRLEIGDKIRVEAEDGTFITTYVLSDVISYAGTLYEITEWEYTEGTSETASNPTSLGDKLNQTFAKVDKMTQEITLYVSEVVDEVLPDKIDESLEGLHTDVENLKAQQTTTTENVTQLQLSTEGITNEVSSLKQTDTVITSKVDDLEAKQTTIEENISSLQLTDESIEARVSAEETKTTEIESDVNDLTSKVETNTTDIGNLKVTTNSINATVSSSQTQMDLLSDTVETLSEAASVAITKDDVTIAITNAMSQGVDKVVTSTKKYTFDDTGLNISNSDSNISTLITEDGMAISRGDKEVLTANNEGVKAEDLHATTYLIIGETSRLEDLRGRTCCFWIGG